MVLDSTTAREARMSETRGAASPRPWANDGRDPRNVLVRDAVGRIAHAERPEDAALIVRAVNAHEALVEALRWALETGRLTYYERTKSNGAHCDAVDRARAALRAAEGDA